MWSNGDVSGRKSGSLSMFFAGLLALLAIWPWLMGTAGLAWLLIGFLLGTWTVVLAARFRKAGDRGSARKLFLFTLLYLPLALTALALFWSKG